MSTVKLRPGNLSSEMKLRLTMEVVRKISSSLDLASVLDLIIDTVSSFINYDAAAIYLLEVWDHQRRVIAQTSRGYDINARAASHLKIGDGIVGWVVKTGIGAIVPDVTVDQRYLSARATTCAEMAVPIRANGKVIGAFNLESDQLNAYTRYDLEILMFFANQAAISIEKAMLHQALMEKKRLEAELAVAQRVQQSLLPKTDPTFGIYEIAGFNISTAEVGGDYFDFIRVGDAHLGVVIADVAGKGVPAALIMASFRASLRAQLCEECTLSRTFRQMNVMLRESGSTDQYVTSLYLNLSPTDYTFSYLNAGHNRPLIIHPDGSYECLDQANTVLGLLPNQRYDEFSHHVTPGDIIVMYTDGITEANRNGEEFGIKRLANSTYQHASLSASLLVRAIYQDVCDFSPCLTDDCTLVVLKVS